MTATPRSTQAGFTLVELMIALVLFSFTIAGVLAVAVSVTQGFREQRQSITAESAVRSPLDYLADALRQASPGVPDPSKVQDAATCAIGAVTVSNATGANDSDELDVIYASGAVVTSSRTAYAGGDNTIELSDASQINVGDHILISDLAAGHLVEVTAKSGDELTLASQCAGINLPPNGYPVGSLVIRAQHGRFFIADLDGIPTLWLDPDGDRTTTPADAEPLAEGIEDMQLAIGIDGDGDGGIAEIGAAAGDDEWFYNVTGETATGTTVRAVRVTLVARTANQLAGMTVPAFKRPKAEDHEQSTTFDAYRRRNLRTTVELRNLGGSP